MGSRGTQFEDLRKSIRHGQVLVPGSDGYEESLKRWSDHCIEPAAVVVKPANSAEAAEAVKFATANNLPLVVKGGGHSTSGAASSNNGMVIDLGLMRSVKVDPAAKTVTMGGGCQWKDVDDEAWKYGLAVVGGTVNETGVGGVTLGGGLGWLSARYGSASDNLIEAEMVLADGSIVIASDKQNPDLFWAIRGAGQFFGVATRFTVKAHDQGNVYTGYLAFTPDKLQNLVDFTNYFHKQKNENSSMFWGPTCTALGQVVGSTGAPPNYEPVILALLFYNSTEEEARAFYKPLMDVALMDTGSVKPYPEANAQFGGPMWKPKRKLHGGATMVPPLKKEDVEYLFGRFLPFIKEHHAEMSTFVFELIMHQKLRAVGPTETAFAFRDEAYSLGITMQWDDPKEDEAVRAFNQSLVEWLKKRGVQNGVSQYNNYATPDAHITLESAFGSNFQRIEELKAKYDPNNVFWKWYGLFHKV